MSMLQTTQMTARTATFKKHIWPNKLSFPRIAEHSGHRLSSVAVLWNLDKSFPETGSILLNLMCNESEKAWCSMVPCMTEQTPSILSTDQGPFAGVGDADYEKMSLFQLSTHVNDVSAMFIQLLLMDQHLGYTQNTWLWKEVNLYALC